MTSRRSIAAPILTMLGILSLLAILLGVYVGGYYHLGERRDFCWSDYPDGSFEVQTCIVRRYPRTWLKTIYLPAGRIETRLGGTNVNIKFTSD